MGLPLILTSNHNLDLGRVGVVVVIEKEVDISHHFYPYQFPRLEILGYKYPSSAGNKKDDQAALTLFKDVAGGDHLAWLSGQDNESALYKQGLMLDILSF